MREVQSFHSHGRTYVGLRKQAQRAESAKPFARAGAPVSPARGWLTLKADIERADLLERQPVTQFAKRAIPETKLRRIVQQLNDLQGLVPAWPTGGVGAPSKNVVDAVRSHLLAVALVAIVTSSATPEPWIASSEDGSVGIEWRCRARRAAVTFDRRGTVEYFATGEGTEAIGALASVLDVVRLASWLLKGTPLDLPANE